MALSTLISTLVPVQAPLAPHMPAQPPAIAPVQQQTASEGATLRHRPQQQDRKPRRQPEPEAEGDAPVQAQVTALIAATEQLVSQANAAGGGPARATELAVKMAAAAARHGLELRGALVVAQRDQVQLGSGSVYRGGTWIAAFTGGQVSFMRGPVQIDQRM